MLRQIYPDRHRLTTRHQLHRALRDARRNRGIAREAQSLYLDFRTASRITLATLSGCDLMWHMTSVHFRNPNTNPFGDVALDGGWMM